MNETRNFMDYSVLAMPPRAEYERLAKIRERQRRERKVELYSYNAKKYINSK